MNRLAEFYNKYKEQLNYLIFGALTTLINIIVYYVSRQLLSINNVVSNILAWLLSVLFAYVTNKLWVFDKREYNLNKLMYEVSSFFGCRLATGVIDIGIMYITVDVLLLPSLLMKILSNILVIILNYIASKIIIFN